MSSHPRACSAFGISLLILNVCGCTILSPSDLKPVITAESTQPHCSAAARASFIEPPAHGIQFELPHPASLGVRARYSSQRVDTDYATYDHDMAAQVSSGLPAELGNNHVVTSLRTYLTAISAESQLQALVDEGSADTSKDNYKTALTAIKKDEKPPHFGASDLKVFTKLLFSQAKYSGGQYLSNTKPYGALIALDTAKPGGAISYCLSAYYKGKFYDSMGILVAMPQLSTTNGSAPGSTNFSIPDAQITAAETVLIEYLCD